MALPSTIHKVELSIADMDRSYYQSHALTVARHPSETEERMMVRILGFALYAHEQLAFGRGLSTDDEPDLWQRDLTGAIERWIDVGLPDDKRIRRAAGRSPSVVVLAFGGAKAEIWWKKTASALSRQRGLEVLAVPAAASQALATLVGRTMRLNVTIEDGHVWVGDADRQIEVVPERWFGAPAA